MYSGFNKIFSGREPRRGVKGTLTRLSAGEDCY